MADVEQEGLADDDDAALDDAAGTDEEGAAGRNKIEPTNKEMAIRQIGRARKILGDDGEPSAAADFLMHSALVHAILDLAEAVRGGPAEPA